MSEKIELSDAMLDAVAGGRITMDGQEVSHIQVYPDGPEATIGGKKIKYQWSDDFVAKSRAEGKSLFDVAMDIFHKGTSDQIYKLEDMVQTP